jgi:hypothetical protein
MRDVYTDFCASYLTTRCAQVATLQAPLAPTRGEGLDPRPKARFRRGMADLVSRWLARGARRCLKRLTSLRFVGQHI